MADSRKLDDLHPRVRMMAERLLADAKAAVIPLTVTFTIRSMETQAALYAQGRTKPGRVVRVIENPPPAEGVLDVVKVPDAVKGKSQHRQQTSSTLQRLPQASAS